MIVFIVLLAAGLVYVIRKGAFDWGARARQEAEAEGKLLAETERKHQAARARTAA